MNMKPYSTAFDDFTTKTVKMNFQKINNSIIDVVFLNNPWHPRDNNDKMIFKVKKLNNVFYIEVIDFNIIKNLELISVIVDNDFNKLLYTHQNSPIVQNSLISQLKLQYLFCTQKSIICKSHSTKLYEKIEHLFEYPSKRMNFLQNIYKYENKLSIILKKILGFLWITLNLPF